MIEQILIMALILAIVISAIVIQATYPRYGRKKYREGWSDCEKKFRGY